MGALRRGKWALGVSLPDRGAMVVVLVGETERRKLEENIDRCVREALMAGYELGLRGGVPRGNVRTCPKCEKPFILVEGWPHGPCYTCWAEENP